MIYLLHGERNTAREKLHQLVESLRDKKPNAHYFHIDDESQDEVALEELIGSQGLFEKKYIVTFDNILESNLGEKILEELELLKDSDHIFIILEEKIDKKTVTKLEKYAEKVQKFNTREGTDREQFNIFSLTDALGTRDSKKTWILYQRAKFSHMADEELFGILSWQVRAMLRASESKSPEEAGLKPFPYRKAKTHAKNYSEEELIALSSNLIVVYHEARRGTHELGEALELLLLNI